ncbi:MAG: Uma2 family endonuclease [Raineya sp.]|nr:Uma2 family endonuclease [Raineya sp.]
MLLDTKTSVTDYLLGESKNSHKSEFWAGQVVAMAGASPTHNILVSNLITLLNNCLRQKDCLVLPSDMLVKVPACESYFYPDVVIVCQKPEYEENQGVTALLNPTIIIEVLSPSTAQKDNTDKLECYLNLQSLMEYHLVDSRKKYVKSYYKQNEKDWILHIYPNTEEKVRIGECELEFKEIYWKTNL